MRILFIFHVPGNVKDSVLWPCSYVVMVLRGHNFPLGRLAAEEACNFVRSFSSSEIFSWINSKALLICLDVPFIVIFFSRSVKY